VSGDTKTPIWKIGGAAAAITSVTTAADTGSPGVIFSANAISGVEGGESFTIGASNTLTITADATCDTGNTTVELVNVIANLSTAGTITVTEGGVLKLAANGGIFATASTTLAAVYGNKVASEANIATASALPNASSVGSSSEGYISSTGNSTNDTSVTGGATITNAKTFVGVNVANLEDSDTNGNDGEILVGSALE
jgi:hypothetical protein